MHQVCPILLAGLVVLVSSCSHVYYMPNMQHVPLLEEKGDVSASADLVESEYSEGFELQGAYAVGDHVAVMGGYTRMFSTENDLISGRYYEGGAGSYWRFGKHGIAEAFLNVGSGLISSSQLTSSFLKFNVQPAIGYTSKNFEAAVAIRLARIDISIEDDDRERYFQEDPNVGSWFLIEPGAVIRVGSKNLKLQIQYCRSFGHEEALLMLRQNFSLGLQFSLK